MSIAAEKFSVLSILLTILLTACGTKTETKVVTIPDIQTVNIPVAVPGETKTINVPQIVAVDKSVGIKSLPKPIEEATETLKSLSGGIGKVFSATGSSGSGFFISKDGLFLTNEHVIPISACAKRKCPGYKIVTGFYKDGKTRVYSDFEVLAQNNGEYDFSLIKVNLNPDEQVKYFDLELDKSKFDLSSDGAAHLVLGHPAGAGLKYAEAKPVSTYGVSVKFQAIVIPGNSGGPLVSLATNKVIGLVKSMRTMPTIDGLGSAYFENINNATTISDLNRYVQENAGLPLLEVTSTTNMKALDFSSAGAPTPDEDDFGSFLRRPSDERSTKTLDLFMRLIGSPDEQKALSLMLLKSKKFSGAVNSQTLQSLLKLSLAVGRPLNFDSEDLIELEAELNLSGNTFPNAGLLILLNYFSEQKRSELQKICVKSVPAVAEALIMAPYNCSATKLEDGKSIFPLYAEWLINKSDYKTLEEMSKITAFLWFSSAYEIKDSEDLNAIEQIYKYSNEKIRDLESVMRNDAYVLGILKSQVGIGSFKDTFPLPN